MKTKSEIVAYLISKGLTEQEADEVFLDANTDVAAIAKKTLASMEAVTEKLIAIFETLNMDTSELKALKEGNLSHESYDDQRV